MKKQTLFLAIVLLTLARLPAWTADGPVENVASLELNAVDFQASLANIGSPFLSMDSTLDIGHLQTLDAATQAPWTTHEGLAAHVLAAGLTRRYFLESHHTHLKALLGEERLKALYDKAEKLAIRKQLLMPGIKDRLLEHAQLLHERVSPRLEELDAAIISLGNSMDGGASARESLGLPPVSHSPSDAFTGEDRKAAVLQHQSYETRTPAQYRHFLGVVRDYVGMDIPFRVADEPLFLPEEQVEKMARDGHEILQQLIRNQSYLERASREIPPEFQVPMPLEDPDMAMLDFVVAQNGWGQRLHQLLELQGFPSLFGFQALLSQAYIDAFGLDPSLRIFLAGIERMGDFARVLREVIIGDHHVRNAVLMEIEPEKQKTRPDFLATKKLLGIETVATTDIHRDGKDLYYYDQEGRRTQIEVIYNRAIPDDLLKKENADKRPPFRFNEELNVKYVPDPRWYYLLSKFALPFVEHEAVPGSKFLHEISHVELMTEAELSDYVLKRLFGYAGDGVFTNPKPGNIAAIPQNQRHNWVLQKKINIARHIPTPFGLTKSEIRLMYVRHKGRIIPIITLVRLGRNDILGVGYNNESWSGSSAGLMVPHN